MTPRLACLLLFALVARAIAQPAPKPDEPPKTDEVVPKPEPPAEPATDDDETVKPVVFDPATCRQKKPPAPTKADVNLSTLTDFEVTGKLIDPPDKVRALLAKTMERHKLYDEDLRREATDAAGAIGYHVIGIGTRDAPNGRIAQIALAPLPLIRRIDIRIKQRVWDFWGTPLFEDEVKRRMRLRQGSYLPWSFDERQCELDEETKRIEAFLRDEGYYDARATIAPQIDGAVATLVVRVSLGESYTVDIDKICIVDETATSRRSRCNGEQLPIAAQEIRKLFKPKPHCLIFGILCYGKPRFRRETFIKNLQDVVQKFHNAEYPSVRVSPSQPIPNRRTHEVEFSLTIDPRRRVQVIFEGDHTASDANLRKQLTFDKAQSGDDVEAAESARAIAAYLQSRGYFDARVTWRREQFADVGVDNLIFRISQGPGRTVRDVVFEGDLALDPRPAVVRDQLLDAIITKPVGRTAKLLGAKSTATSAGLAADVERLRALYRREGFRDARITVTAATDPSALGSAALAAAMVGADRGDDLYVRFSINAGPPTLLTQIHVDLGKSDEITNDDDRALCKEVLKDLAELYRAPGIATPVSSGRCIGIATNLRYRQTEAEDSRDIVKERLFGRGRPRTDVAIDPQVLGPQRVAMHYKLRNTQLLKIGTIVIRGNFRTATGVIEGELKYAKFEPGKPLTASAIANGTRALRNTGLFDAANIRLLDLETTTAGALNAVVEVTERYDRTRLLMTALDLELGYGSLNGAFVKLLPTFRNLGGYGISLETSLTAGFDVGEAIDGNLTFQQLAAEATLRIPEWLIRRKTPDWLPFQYELTGFTRRQDTPRFGLLRTDGVTQTWSHTISRPHVGTTPARALTLGAHYDYRRRIRNIDVLRPVGADDDDSQVPVTTTTGSFALFAEWEQRVDRGGALQPLAPEGGFRLFGEVAYADPWLSLKYGQDRFLKVSSVVSKYWPLASNLVVRADLRYDHGFPLGGAALLPEVERFFAGGDSTVRGYEDDRLATEIVEVAVPPLDNLRQIRVLPAGGNIRALGSVDAQLRIYKLLSTALFFDCGVITNQWQTVTIDDIRPSVGMALIRVITPFGAFAMERAVPIRPQLGDNPTGRWHISFAARAQF